jgi:hypothetical protein
MLKSEIEKDLASGQNLVIHHRKVMLLVEVNNRPSNCIGIANLDSGARYICAPEEISAVVGTVVVGDLPWNKSVTENEVPVQVGSPIPFTTPTGLTVAVGQKVKLANGETAEYLGYNRAAPRYPLNLKMLSGRQAGQVMRFAVFGVIGLAA